MIGEAFGRWMVIGPPVGRKLLCQCVCGTQRYVRRTALHDGTSKSCGCYNAENAPYRRRTHGHGTHSRRHGGTAYASWRNARERCYNPSNQYFAVYGGRGIAICERWQDFAAFLADMGERPPGTSLDRIDNNRGYEPGNCRWADSRTQAANKRHIPTHTFEGHSGTLKDIARALGLHYGRLRYNVNICGRSLEDSVAYMRHAKPNARFMASRPVSPSTCQPSHG